MKWEPLAKATLLSPIADFRLSRPAEMLGLAPGEPWWSVLVDLRNSSLSALEQQVNAAFPSPALLIPDVFSAAERDDHLAQQIVPLFVRASVVQALNTPSNPYGIAALDLGIAFSNSAILAESPPAPDQPDIAVPADTVVMAVIDDGIAIAHEVFCKDTLRSRVDLAYVMAQNDSEPPSHTQGHSLSRDRIDALLKAHTYNGLLDETAFYQSAGIIDFGSNGFSPAALARSHGTHITSLAAGYLSAPEASRPILCAMLPSQVTWDVTGQNLAPSLALALKVLLRQAKRYRLPDGSPAPVVFNFSYGTYGGPHDGTGQIARLLEHHFGPTAPQNLRLVLPAGNGNLSRTHATLCFAPKTRHPLTLDLEVPPDDRTANHVQHWLPYADTPIPPVLVSLRVTPPGGPQSPPLFAREGEGLKLVNDQGAEVARLSYDLHPWPTQRGEITLSLHPTESLAADAALAPAGRWQIEVSKVDLAADQVVQVWVSREETLPGFPPFGRQAHFDAACYQMFDAIGAPLAVDPRGSDCPVRRAGMLSEFATGASPVVIAGFTASNGRLSDYSAAGPITPARGQPHPNRTGPDAAAASDDSPALAGLLGAGNRRGSFVRLNGTSVAAPSVARYLASGLAKGKKADRGWVAKQAGKQDSNYPPPKPEESRSGGGRLNLKQPFTP
jgi:hypothetical protein